MARIVSSSATHKPEDAGLAWDGQPSTRWTSGVARKRTMRFWLELDTSAMIGGINARAADDNDNPRKWQVHVADSDGGHGDKIVTEGSGPIIATWPAVRGQWVLIDCLDEDAYWWWSLNELAIDATDIPPEPPPPDPDVLVGPMALEEPAARYLVEQLAKKWGWPVRQRDGVDFTTGVVTVEQSVSFMVARARAQGILEPFPFT